MMQEKLNLSIAKLQYSDSLKYLIIDLLQKNPSIRPNYFELVEKISRLDQTKFAIHLYTNLT